LRETGVLAFLEEQGKKIRLSEFFREIRNLAPNSSAMENAIASFLGKKKPNSCDSFTFFWDYDLTNPETELPFCLSFDEISRWKNVCLQTEHIELLFDRANVPYRYSSETIRRIRTTM
jgi:hypothetical protein